MGRINKALWCFNIAVVFYLIFALALTQDIQVFGDLFFSEVGFAIMFLFFIIEWVFITL